jgi:hypothetical protein
LATTAVRAEQARKYHTAPLYEQFGVFVREAGLRNAQEQELIFHKLINSVAIKELVLSQNGQLKSKPTQTTST